MIVLYIITYKHRFTADKYFAEDIDTAKNIRPKFKATKHVVHIQLKLRKKRVKVDKIILGGQNYQIRYENGHNTMTYIPHPSLSIINKSARTTWRELTCPSHISSFIECIYKNLLTKYINYPRLNNLIHTKQH